MRHPRDVVITGIGLVTSLGVGNDANWQALRAGVAPVIDLTVTPPFPVHPIASIDYDQQIPRKGDQRQMEPWQRIGVYAAGLALQDAGVAGNGELLGRTHMVTAAGGGERDIAVDEAIMSGMRQAQNKGAYLNERLANDLRPTLFLAQLSNLLAGNISIVHGVVGSSRTFMGEEPAGFDALRIMAARIRAGQADLGLVGGSYSAHRPDMSIIYAFANGLIKDHYVPVWERAAQGGGMIMGGVGAFLVIEAREHAEARNVRVLASLGAIAVDRGARSPGATADRLSRLWRGVAPAMTNETMGVLSGASGIATATAEEHAFLTTLARERAIAVRATGSRIGHSFEASAPANVALAALALSRDDFLLAFGNDVIEAAAATPSHILVTSVGHWRGEGLIMVGKA